MIFDFYLSGYGRDSYRLQLNQKGLSISEYIIYPVPVQQKVISVADNQSWQLHLAFLRNCNWKKKYDRDTLDGTQWELKVRANGIIMDSYGSNAYPDDFDVFLVLLNNIVRVVNVSFLT